MRRASETPKTTAGDFEVRHVPDDGAGRRIGERPLAGSLQGTYIWLGGLPIAEFRLGRRRAALKYMFGPLIKCYIRVCLDQ